MKELVGIITLLVILIFTASSGNINSEGEIADNTWQEFLAGSTDFWYKEMAYSYSGSVSNNYSRNGMPAYRIELRKTDPIIDNGKRSEIQAVNPEPAASRSIYKFSILLPNGGDEDYTLDPDGDEIIAQWHNTRDQGEDWTFPPLSLHTQGDGHYCLWRCWDEDPLTTDEKLQKENKIAIYDLGSYLDDKGKWVDWQFHVKWGWLASQHPVIEVYKNGDKIFELKDQPNTTNDKKGVYAKLGIYKWEWGHEDICRSIITKRIVYYSEVEVTYGVDDNTE